VHRAAADAGLGGSERDQRRLLRARRPGGLRGLGRPGLDLRRPPSRTTERWSATSTSAPPTGTGRPVRSRISAALRPSCGTRDDRAVPGRGARGSATASRAGQERRRRAGSGSGPDQQPSTGVRVSAATAYLPPPWGHVGVGGRADRVRPRSSWYSTASGSPRARRAGVRRGRRRGGDRRWRPGAVGTPRLLLQRSGIGPEDTLRGGRRVAHELPGVGQWLLGPPRRSTSRCADGLTGPAHAARRRQRRPRSTWDAGDRPGRRPRGPGCSSHPFAPGGPAASDVRAAAPRQPRRCSPSPRPRRSPRLDFRYLRTDHDRRRLRPRGPHRRGDPARRGPGRGRRRRPRRLTCSATTRTARRLDPPTTSRPRCTCRGTAAMGSGRTPSSTPTCACTASSRAPGGRHLGAADASPRRGPSATAVA
jgi:choline dehydrogenase